MFNILDEPLVENAGPEGKRREMSLPQTYEALMRGETRTFPSLRPHQQHAWHAFLTQLAVLAVRRDEAEEPPDDAGEWRRMILNLTDGATEPWELLVEDRAKPAFMQPPSGETGKPGLTQRTPDNADYLATSKNFEEKQEMIWDATPGDWIFALVSLQTMAQYIGAGTYSTSRMNGGSASRPALSLAPAGGPGQHLRRDIGVLLSRTSPGWDSRPALLWTLEWNGGRGESLPLRNLHPLYIDAARRIRLAAGPGGRLEARKFTSKTARSDSKSSNGITGDPWAPAALSKSGAKLLTIDRNGFGQNRVARIALDSKKWRLSLLAEPAPGEERQENIVLTARCAAGGQSETNGFHHLEIPLGPGLAQAMQDPETAERALEEVQLRSGHIDHIYECLCEAVAAYIAGGDARTVTKGIRKMAQDRLRPHAKAGRQASAYHALMDRTFLEDLQEALDAEPERRQEIHADWLLREDGAVERARAMLHAMTPTPSGGNPAPELAARGLFEGVLRNRKKLPEWLLDHMPEAARPEPAAGETEERSGAARQAPEIAAALTNLALRKPQVLGELRRMNPENPDSETFRHLVRNVPEAEEPGRRTGWATVVRGMALMTQVHAENYRRNSAHRRGRTLGRAMFLGDERRPVREFLSQGKINRMMGLTGSAFLAEVNSIFGLLGQAGAKLDWEDAAGFVLENGEKGVRTKVYQDYLEAKYRPRQPQG